MNPSERIDQLIAGLTDWRGMGSPVWSRDGIIAVGNAHKDKVKLTFSRGASLPDPDKFFNARRQRMASERFFRGKIRLIPVRWRRASPFCKPALKKSTSSISPPATVSTGGPACGAWIRVRSGAVILPRWVQSDLVHLATGTNSAEAPAVVSITLPCCRNSSAAPPPSGGTPSDSVRAAS
jgi:hypothetical protein